VAAAAVIALAALGAMRLESGVRVEGLARNTDPPVREEATTAELVAAPHVRLGLRAPELAFSGAYEPRVSAPDVLSDARVDVLHEVELQAEWTGLPVWELTASAAGVRGRTDLITEALRGDGDPRTIPTAAPLRYTNVRADLALEGSPDPRTVLELTAGWFFERGNDAASRVLLPTQRGIRARATYRRNVTRRDILGVNALGEGGRFPGDRTSAFALALATWRRKLMRELDGWAGAGAVGSFFEGPEGVEREVRPAGEVGLAHQLPRWRLDEELRARLGAGIDRLTGEVSPELEVSAVFGLAPTAAWSFSGRGVGTFTRLEDGDTRRGSLDLRARRRLGPRASLELGVYGLWQRSDSPGVPSLTEYGTVLAFAVDAPPFTW
jgi:hypothetical protein